MTKKSGQKFKYLENEKSFSSLLKGLHWSKSKKFCLQGESLTLKLLFPWYEISNKVQLLFSETQLLMKSLELDCFIQKLWFKSSQPEVFCKKKWI